MDLLYDHAPNVDMERLTERVQDICGRVDPDWVPEQGDRHARYHLLDGEAQSRRGPILSQLCLQPLNEAPDREQLTASLHQTWDWAEAQAIANDCTHVVMVHDFMTTMLPPALRNRQFQAFLRAVMEVAPPRAMHWINSQMLMDPARFTALQAEEDAAALYGSINVRFFRLEGTDDDCLMDTLGLSAFGLPDVQCHFCELSPADVAGVLHEVACQLFVRGSYLKDGDTVPGIQSDDLWHCLHELSLAGPERLVVDLHPGVPFAAGNRPSAISHSSADAPFTIRAVAASDKEALARLYLDSRCAHFDWTSRDAFALSDFERDSEGEVIHVACDSEGQIAGFVSVWEAESFIHLLFIAPGRERQGIGRLLLQHTATWLPFPQRLKCVEANASAVAFYRRLGWLEIGQGVDGQQPYLEMAKLTP